MISGSESLIFRKLAPHALDRTSQISATRPERAEAPSPGQRPGFFMPASLSPCKGKSFKTTTHPFLVF